MALTNQSLQMAHKAVEVISALQKEYTRTSSGFITHVMIERTTLFKNRISYLVAIDTKSVLETSKSEN